MAISEQVFNNRDNENILQFKFVGGDYIDFIDRGVTKIEVIIERFTLSSEDGDVEFDNEGRVTFRLGHLGLNVSTYDSLKVAVYDAAHPSGQMILNKGMPYSSATVSVYKGD